MIYASSHWRGVVSSAAGTGRDEAVAPITPNSRTDPLNFFAMHRVGILVFLASAALLACRSHPSKQDAAAASSSGAGASPAGVPGSPCAEASQLRSKATSHFEQGRLLRTINAIDRADKLCPAERPRTWGLLVRSLAELGLVDRSKALVSEIEANAAAAPAVREAAKEAKLQNEEQAKVLAEGEEARKPMRERLAQAERDLRAGEFQKGRAGFLEAWKFGHPNPQALAKAGRCAWELGDKPQAQRLFDRAYQEALKSGEFTVEEQSPILGATRIAWSRDGRVIAMAHGNALSILEGHTFLQRGPILRGHSQKINALSLTADGRLLATASADGTVRLWDPIAGKHLRKLISNWSTVHSVVFSPEGKLIASDSNHLVRLWDIYTARIKDTLQGHKDAINAIAFSADGQWVAAGAYDNVIGLWDVRGAALVRKFYREGLPGSSLAFSPDGKLLAANTARKILLWEVATGKVEREFGDKEWADYLAFHPAGALLASASTGASSDRIVRLWNVANGQLVRELKGHTGDPTALAFDQEGTLLGAGAEDSTVLFWDTESGRVVETLRRGALRLGALACSPDSRWLTAVAGDDQLLLFDLEEGTLSRSTAVKATTATFTADGKNVLAADQRDRSLKILEASSGKVLKEIPAAGAAGAAVAWTLDRKRLAVAGADSTIAIIDTATGQSVAQWKAGDRAHALAFSPEGKSLAVGAGYQDKAVRIFDVEAGTVYRKLPAHKDRSTAIAFSPEGRYLASGSDDHTVQLWDTKHWLPRALQVPTGAITSIAFNGPGTVLAVGSEDAVIRLWDPALGKVMRELAGHDAAVRTMAFSPNGHWLASGGEDGAIRLWAMPEGTPLATLRAVSAKAWYIVGRGQSREADRVALGGEAAREAESFLVCRFGALAFPFEVCRDQVQSERFLGAVLRRQAFSDPP